MYALNQCPAHGAFSPTAGIYWSRNRGVGKKIVPLTISPSDPLGKILLLVPKTLSCVDLKFWFRSGWVFLP